MFTYYFLKIKCSRFHVLLISYLFFDFFFYLFCFNHKMGFRKLQLNSIISYVSEMNRIFQAIIFHLLSEASIFSLTKLAFGFHKSKISIVCRSMALGFPLGQTFGAWSLWLLADSGEDAFLLLRIDIAHETNVSDEHFILECIIGSGLQLQYYSHDFFRQVRNQFFFLPPKCLEIGMWVGFGLPLSNVSQTMSYLTDNTL